VDERSSPQAHRIGHLILFNSEEKINILFSGAPVEDCCKTSKELVAVIQRSGGGGGRMGVNSEET
jgi:hypothetical protein